MITKEPFWALIILLGSMINFFNLIPVSPLDRGRIISVVSMKIGERGLFYYLGIQFILKVFWEDLLLLSAVWNCIE